MADLKISNPKVVGKLKLPAETASKALQISASGELESSSVSNTELGYLSGTTSSVQTQIGSKADASTVSTHISDTANPHSVTKTQVGLGNVDNTSDANKPVSTAQQTALNLKADLASPTFTGTVSGISKSMVGLGNVPNVDATDRANHTGTQLASTISDFSSAAKSAAVADSISNGVTDIAPSQNAVYDALALKLDSSVRGANNGVASLDAGGKVPVSQLPSSVMEFKGVFDPASATFTDATGNAGDVYLASVAGSYDAGSGSITYAIGDWAVHNGTIFQKSLNSNAVVSVNSQTGIVSLNTSHISATTDKNYVTDADLTHLSNLSGTNSGDQTITLTGDVTGSGTGSFATTIGASKVTSSMLAGSIDATKIADGSVTSTEFQYINSLSSNAQDQIDSKVAKNTAITGATKTKVTYDAKGLVTAGTDATTADIADSLNKRYVSDSDLTHLSNLSGTNTGDQDLSGYVLNTRTVNGHALSADVTVTKSDVSLGNVDNVQQLPMSYLDTDNTLAANSDAKVASQKAIKAYIATAIGDSSHVGDIAHTSFAASNNQSSAASITGFAFAAASVRSFKALVSVSIDATSGLNESFDLQGIQLAGGFVLSQSSVGDDSGIIFSITSAGQIQYTSTNVAGFVSSKINFRASVTDV